MKLRSHNVIGSMILSLCLFQSAQADIFDVNSTTAGFGVTNGSTYNWLDAAGYWADTTAVNDGTAATVAWQGSSGVSEQAYFIGSGTAGDNYTVRLGTDGSSNVFIQNIAINVLANGSAAAPSTLGNVTIGNVGDTGNLVIRAANSVGAQNGGTLTINNGVNMNAQVLNFRGGNVVINGSVSGGAGSNISSGGGAFGLGGGTLTLAGNNSFSGNTSVASGYVFSLQHANALGNTGGTNTVSSGGTMEVANGVTIGTGESISIAGDGSSSFGALRAGTGGGTWSGGVTLTANARLGATASNTLTVTGSISGSFGLLISGQSGTGVVVLNPTTSNSYTGPTSIIRGILRLGKNDALNTGTTLDVDAIQSVADAATFDMAGFNQTVAALQDSASTSVGGLITNSASSTTSTLTVNQSSNTAFDGIIQNGSGSVVLTKSGSGTLTLNAANTYTGGTNIRNGAIILGGGNNRLATTSSVSLGDVATSGKLVLGDATTARNQTLAGLTATGLGGNVVGAHATTNSVLTLSIASGTNTFAGVLGGSGTNENNLALIKNGAGTLALNSANSLIGGITLDQGTLNIGNAGALGTGSFTSATNINTLTNTSGSAITLSNSSFAINNSLIFGGSTSANNINTGSGAISLSGSERIVSVNSGVAVTFGGAVTGTNLRKDGLGTLVLAGANTGLGALRVTGGVTQLTGSTANTTTLILGHASSTGIGKFILGSENGAVNQTFASIQSTGTEQSSQSIVGGHSSLATLTINQSTSTTYAGTIGGAGTNENNLALTKTGSGTLVLSGANTYTGLTTVNGGELRISNASAIGGSNVTVSAGQLVLDGGITVTDKSLTTNGSGTNFSGGLQSNSGVNTWNGGVTLGTDLSRMGARLGATLVIAGVIDDGVNNYSLVVRNGNTSNTNGGGNASTITEISGINTYGGNTQLIAGVTRLGGGDNRLPTGTVMQFGLAGANAKFDMNGFDQEVAGLAVTNTTNDASRDWNANELTNSSSTLSTLTVNTTSNQTFGLTTTSFTGSTNYTGVITGNLALEKKGSATLTLTSANTYTGATNVNAGKLVISSTGSTAAGSAVTVSNAGSELVVDGTLGGALLINSGATLSGSGTISGSATIAGIHNAGNSPGVQTFSGDLGYQAGSTVNWELGGNTTTQTLPAIFDQIVVGGNLSFASTTTVNLLFNTVGSSVDWGNALWDSNQSWTLFDVAGTTTGLENVDLATSNWADSNGTLFNTARNGSFFTLSLSGQDVMLNYTAVPETSVSLLGGLSALLLMRRKRR